MKLVMLKLPDLEVAAIAAEHGYVPMTEINRLPGADFATTAERILRRGEWPRLRRWYDEGGRLLLGKLPAVPPEEAVYAPLLRHPGKIIGIGMNYMAKLEELQGDPDERDPLIFLKPDTALIGQGASVVLPPDVGTVTAEAELAVVIGARCRSLPLAEAAVAAAGYAAALDMTAADILRSQPRHLARAKGYDTFVSLGSELLTADEPGMGDGQEVATVLNGGIHTCNTVGRMRYSPAFLISYLSGIMTLMPGDVILTGTPGSVPIARGDAAECRISGFMPLVNPVREAAR